MDVAEIINKKKEELIEEVKQETEGLGASIANKAVEKLEQYAAELKTALDMHPIGATDLLRVLEKGGVVHQSVRSFDYRISVGNFLDEVSRGIRPDYFEKGNKQRVTIIIEPIE